MKNCTPNKQNKSTPNNVKQNEIFYTNALLTIFLFLILTIGYISLALGQTTVYTENLQQQLTGQLCQQLANL